MSLDIADHSLYFNIYIKSSKAELCVDISECCILFDEFSAWCYIFAH